MNIEQEFLLINLQSNFLNTLKWHLININDDIFLYRVFNLLKQKYNNVDDFNFVENIRTNLNKQNIPKTFYNINGIVNNYRNLNLLKDFIKCLDSSFKYDIIKRFDNTDSLILNNTEITMEQNVLIETTKENTNILVDKQK